MFESMKASQNEAESVNRFLSSTMAENDLLCLCQKAHWLGINNATVLAKRELPYLPMEWLKSELFDPLVSKESVEALGVLFRVANTEQNVSHNVLHNSLVASVVQGHSS
ncbi:hypothetical protein ACH5RR_013066 [Cinchona calisaya]|uniref:Uncharacterized protein n=1 Tax=Cinchona calisaya TaxID=153742 RepID=A0ABD2ZZ30_9GENT